MQHPATGELPVVDTDVDAGTPVWDALADRWATVKALQAQEVPADASA